MTQSSLDLLQQQYDNLPYPQIPLEQSPHEYYDTLFIHDLTTPYYLYQQKIINTKDKLILDAGCGTGWTSLFLAYANPQAKIIGVDLSPKSIEVAKARFKHHGFSNGEFYALSLDNIQELNYVFDYINCDEVIYLLPNPEHTLKLFQSILKEQGIIRVNFHSYYQRSNFFRMQQLFQNIGLLNDDYGDLEVELVQETMNNLKESVQAKQVWQSQCSKFLSQPQKMKEIIMVNYLLQGDKGYTVPQVFNMLKSSSLDFLSMVMWRKWNIRELFKKPHDLPEIWEMGLEDISLEDELSLYELINPVHRLIDFWCVNKSTPPMISPLITWQKEDWQKAKIALHPRLKSPKIKADFLKAIEKKESFLFNRYIAFPALGNVEIESSIASCFLPLWEQEKVIFSELVKRWLTIQPHDLLSLQTKSESLAMKELINEIVKLESFLYLLVEK